MSIHLRFALFAVATFIVATAFSCRHEGTNAIPPMAIPIATVAEFHDLLKADELMAAQLSECTPAATTRFSVATDLPARSPLW